MGYSRPSLLQPKQPCSCVQALAGYKHRVAFVMCIACTNLHRKAVFLCTRGHIVHRCVLRSLTSVPGLQMLLKDAAPKEGQAFTYNYDMTDPWAHIVEVLSISDGGDLTTKLVDGKRAGIPEVMLPSNSVPDFGQHASPFDIPLHQRCCCC